MFGLFKKKLTIKDFTKKRCTFNEYYEKYKKFPEHLYIDNNIYSFDREDIKECKIFKESKHYLIYKNIKNGEVFEWMWFCEALDMKHFKIIQDGNILEQSFLDYATKHEAVPTLIKHIETGDEYKFYSNSGHGMNRWKNYVGYKHVKTEKQIELMWYGYDRLFDVKMIPIVKV